MEKVGEKRDKSTIDATRQSGIHSAIILLSWSYQSYQMYRLKQLQGQFATDTFFDDMKSLHRNTYCQVYSHKSGFAA